MSDLFISYSSHDKMQALKLAERLRQNGYDVWIDKTGIDAATTWSAEIVEAIKDCKAFLILLSPDAVSSHNVTKEVALASEKRKTIIPVMMRTCELSSAIEYALAGLQYVGIDELDSIMRAVNRAVDAHAFVAPKGPGSARLTLAVLPFDDLSPSHDNEWFSDGMMDELINTLGSFEQIEVNPRNDVIYYKGKHPKLEDIALDLKARYIVSGSVQKAGDRIRIRVSLSDAREHKQLWSDKYDGNFDDIFDLQDKTCYAIAEALKLKLTPAEEQKIEDRPTANAEAYQLYLKGLEYYKRHTRIDYEHAITLYEHALRLDPGFALAHLELANTSHSYHRRYSREPKWLAQAETHLHHAEALEGETAHVLWMRSLIALDKENAESASELALAAIAIDATYGPAYDALALAYLTLDKLEEAIAARKTLASLNQYDCNAHFNYLVLLSESSRVERLAPAALAALPLFERHLRFAPDDLNTQIQYACALAMAGERSRAIAEADRLERSGLLDGIALFSVACLYMFAHAPDRVIPALEACIEKGYRNIYYFRHKTLFKPLEGTPAFESLVSNLEKKIAEERLKA